MNWIKIHRLKLLTRMKKNFLDNFRWRLHVARSWRKTRDGVRLINDWKMELCPILMELRGPNRPAEIMTPAEPDPNSINFLVAGDHNGLNAGSFFLRQSEWAEMFLDLWRDPLYVERDWPGREQDAMIPVIQHHKFVSNYVGIVPQWLINSYWEGPENIIRHENDLIVHIAGFL